MSLSASREESRKRLDACNPRMVKADLRSEATGDPRKAGTDHKHEIGQCLEWALDRARVTKDEAGYALGYTDTSVISRWTNGKERLQLDKLREHLPAVYRELLIALLQIEGGVSVRTVIEMPRVG